MRPPDLWSLAALRLACAGLLVGGAGCKDDAGDVTAACAMQGGRARDAAANDAAGRHGATAADTRSNTGGSDGGRSEQDGPLAVDGSSLPDAGSSTVVLPTQDAAPRLLPDVAAMEVAVAIDMTGRDTRAFGECADLDGNGVLDCKETVLANPDFPSDILGWTTELEVAQTFVRDDGDGNMRSGAIAVSNGTTRDIAGATMAGSRQCVAAASGAAYRLIAQTRIPGPKVDGVSAGVYIQYYRSVGCAGDPAGTYAGPLVDAVDAWRPVEGLATAPAGARSMSVRLVVVKPFRAAPARALFDNVLLKVQ